MISEINANPLIKPVDILLTGDDVAKILNISRSFAFQLMRQGGIPTVKLGRSVRVRKADLDQFISENTTTHED